MARLVDFLPTWGECLAHRDCVLRFSRDRFLDKKTPSASSSTTSTQPGAAGSGSPKTNWFAGIEDDFAESVLHASRLLAETNPILEAIQLAVSAHPNREYEKSLPMYSFDRTGRWAGADAQTEEFLRNVDLKNKLGPYFVDDKIVNKDGDKTMTPAAGADPVVDAQPKKQARMFRTGAHVLDHLRKEENLGAFKVALTPDATSKVTILPGEFRAQPWDTRGVPPVVRVTLGKSIHMQVGMLDLRELLNLEIVEDHNKKNSEQMIKNASEGGKKDKEEQLKPGASQVAIIGLSKSHRSYAKCCVLVHMLRDPAVPVLAILEVWYSSVWAPATLTAFRNACKQLVEDPGTFGMTASCKAALSDFLPFWLNQEPLPLAEAYRSWMRNHGELPDERPADDGHGQPLKWTCFQACCNLREPHDSEALVDYCFTGNLILQPPPCSSTSSQILNEGDSTSTLPEYQPDEEIKSLHRGGNNNNKKSKKRGGCKEKEREMEDKVEAFLNERGDEKNNPRFNNKSFVGNVTIWNTPEADIQLLQNRLHALAAMSMAEYLEERKVRYSLAEQKEIFGFQFEPKTIVDLFISRTARKLWNFRKLLRADKILFSFMQMPPLSQPKSQRNFYEAIGEVKPTSISWNDEIDRFTCEDFHEIARRCCAADKLPPGHSSVTKHYGYSFRWVYETLGTQLTDFGHPDGGAENDEGSWRVQAILDELLGREGTETRQKMEQGYSQELEEWVSLPVRAPLLPLSGHFLQSFACHTWVKHFGDKAEAGTAEEGEKAVVKGEGHDEAKSAGDETRQEIQCDPNVTPGSSAEAVSAPAASVQQVERKPHRLFRCDAKTDGMRLFSFLEERNTQQLPLEWTYAKLDSHAVESAQSL
ncbi:unnamed protein product [Amoebophrya sp. A120]|nr:unnamed protein product [Amoebophrya sp. A120]|eukprot:GSA120T00001616001.1